ncbi:MAG: dihydrolipoamide acetyltransferase family protein, partial [Acidimicrobiia bacterium]
MAHEFHLPDVGEGLTEAIVVSWYVAVGEPVSLDEPLVEIETDKAVVDVPSPYAGVVLHHGAAPGETVAVDDLLAVVGEAGEQWTTEDELPAAGEQPDAGSGEAAPIVGTLEPTAAVRAGTEASALPRVRRLAAELGVDLTGVAGTGRMGRITEDDVRNARGADRGPVERVAMTPTRRAIAAHLSRSWREIPHVTTYGEADAVPLLARREASGKPPLEALLIALLVPVLRRFPAFNASVEGDTVVHKLHYDIGFAVDTEDGLMVAVVSDAAGKDVAALAADIRRLAGAVRDRTA